MNAISVRRSRASALSERAYMSSPAKSTCPTVGRSSPPRRWSSVDFPPPEAPIRATLSPALTDRLTPRSTRTVSGPTRYSRSSSRAATSASLIPEHLDRVQPSGPARRGQRRQERDQQRRARDKREVEPGQLHGKVVDLVHVTGQPDDLVGVLDPDQRQAEETAGRRADEADRHPDRQEDAPDAPRARAHGLEDADLLALLCHEQDQVADDGEARDQHDDRDDDEECQLLELSRSEGGAVHPHPIADPEP